MSITNVSLIVAQLDLNLVRLLRRAMRPECRGHGDEADQSDRRQIIHPEPRIEPRPVIHSNPTYVPQKVLQSPRPNAEVIPIPTAIVAVDFEHRHEPPLEAPWKKIPWQNPSPPVRIVKMPCVNPDNFIKGKIIDCFM